MSVHENDQAVSRIPVLADPDLASVTAAESAVAAFKLALKELGEPVPANDVRAVLTTSGLRLEVTEAPSSTREHYGTPAPVEEVAEFITASEPFGDIDPGVVSAPLDVGDKVRITGDTQVLYHGRPDGTEGEIVEREGNIALVATDPTRREWGMGPRDARWVHRSDLERA